MAKPRVRMQPTRAAVADTQAVKMLNPDAWREGLTTAQRGYDYRWKKARLSHLAKFPLCWYCEQEGRVTAASVVDHSVPHRGNSDIFWDKSLWRSACPSCHNAKTAREEGGIGTARKG